jgi:hypothetical protein
MTGKVAINGLGRIGRAALKLALDQPELELVAVNEIGSIDNMAYLLRNDTVYGRYERQVEVVDGKLVIGGHPLVYVSERDPASLPWADLGSIWSLNAQVDSPSARTRKATCVPGHGGSCCPALPRVQTCRRSSAASTGPTAAATSSPARAAPRTASPPSWRLRKVLLTWDFGTVPPAGIEPATRGLGNRCSLH